MYSFNTCVLNRSCARYTIGYHEYKNKTWTLYLITLELKIKILKNKNQKQTKHPQGTDSNKFIGKEKFFELKKNRALDALILR